MTILLMPNNIPDLLKRKGLTIYKLAKKTGITYNTVYAIVKAEKIADGTAYGTLKRIAKALEVSIDDLETEKEN